jgi:hypothetical protein
VAAGEDRRRAGRAQGGNRLAKAVLISLRIGWARRTVRTGEAERKIDALHDPASRAEGPVDGNQQRSIPVRAGAMR